MISFERTDNFKKADNFLEKLLEKVSIGELDKYGRMGVKALSAATPKDTGRLASSWDYEIIRENGTTRLIWTNDDIEGGCNVAILVQYGHGTKSGHYVEGIDYINPALKPVFDQIAEGMWKEVAKL